MAWRPKLTWQPGTSGRGGRWRKKYKGKAYYFTGGRGKTDRDAHDAAVAEWEALKVRLDAEAPKPHQAEYERAIAEWELVLAWCRKHDEQEMAGSASEKIARLRDGLAVAKPEAVPLENTFEGYFDPAVRHPGLEKLMAVADASFDELKAQGQSWSDIFRPLLAARAIWTEPLEEFDLGDPLLREKAIWHDRLAVMQKAATPQEQTVAAHIEKFIEEKSRGVTARALTAGRVAKLQVQLGHFRDWISGGTAVEEITGGQLVEYRGVLLQQVEAGTWSRTTAAERLSAVKSFVRWLWQIEAIPALPRVIDQRSTALDIGKSASAPVIFTDSEITTLLTQAADRTKLYVLLMLNCGMTQKDVADLQSAEVDWEQARITRRRSKTRHHGSVPVVSYPLWPKTLRLLRQEASSTGSGLVLLNARGEPLWRERMSDEGKYQKTDNVRTAFERLRRKTGINKPMISLKKTSASKLRGHPEYMGLEGLFLGHAPQSIAHRHYARDPADLLDEAISWLGREYGVVKDQAD